MAEDRTEVKIRIDFNISSGSGKFSVKSEKEEETFEMDFGEFGLEKNQSFVFFISAETDLLDEVRPFKFLKCEHNSQPLLELRSALNSYAIILVVAAAFFLCILCGLAEKRPKIGQARELSPNPEDTEIEMGLIGDPPTGDQPK